MSDPVNLATRLERLEATVADLAARLAALEAQPRAAAEPVAPSDEELNLFHLPDGETLSGIPALAGRSCLVLGGAFLVRSLTEAGVVSAPLGVALGLAYAAVWLLLADRAAGAGRTASATFHALAAALIAAPLIVEATLRFAVLGATGGALLLAATTAAALTIAWRRGLHAAAWIYPPAAFAAAALLLFRTRQPLPFVLLLLALAAASLALAYGRGWRGQRWLMAVASDGLILWLGVLRLVPEPTPEWLSAGAVLTGQIGLAAIYLGAFVLRLLVQSRDVTSFAVGQTIAVLAIGFEGALIVGGATSRSVLAWCALAAGAWLHGVLARQSERRHGHGVAVAYFSSVATFLAAEATRVLLPAALFAPLWLAAALVLATLARRGERPVLEVHAALLTLAGAVAAGLATAAGGALLLPASANWPAPTVGTWIALLLVVATAALLQSAPPPSRAARTLALVVALVALGGLLVGVAAAALAQAPGPAADAGILAVLRSALLAVAAVALAIASLQRGRPEHLRLATVVLVLGGLKLLVEDLRVGSAVHLVFSLALYGSALIVVPALARRARRRLAGAPAADLPPAG